jgi:hypothetical protein
LGQVYGALAYYYDHKDEIDHEIENLQSLADSLRPQLENPLITGKLRRARKDGG